jgi:hypothetical protein
VEIDGVQQRPVQVEDGGFRQFRILHGANAHAYQSASGVFFAMCRLRCELSFHHTGPRSAFSLASRTPRPGRHQVADEIRPPGVAAADDEIANVRLPDASLR